ncbi:hypothetical protein LCGC14_0537190 [marine sediment metagenome]|uniref:Uncharacterized protein n=1 Tax=marine sediment metagenome TaxID=412755 RepID=A0A0F9RYI6_9ZZZZ
MPHQSEKLFGKGKGIWRAVMPRSVMLNMRINIRNEPTLDLKFFKED